MVCSLGLLMNCRPLPRRVRSRLTKTQLSDITHYTVFVTEIAIEG